MRPLRNEVGNFFLFEDEVKTAPTSIFEKHCVGQSSLKRAKMSRIPASAVLEGEVKMWLKMLHRRLSPRMKAVEFKRAMSSEIFFLNFSVCKKGPFRLWCFVQRRKTHRCNLLSSRDQTHSRFCQVIRAKQRLSLRIRNEEE